MHCQVADTASFARRRDRVEEQGPNLLAGLLKIKSVVLNGTVHEFRSVTWICGPHMSAVGKCTEGHGLRSFGMPSLTPDYT